MDGREKKKRGWGRPGGLREGPRARKLRVPKNSRAVQAQRVAPPALAQAPPLEPRPGPCPQKGEAPGPCEKQNIVRLAPRAPARQPANQLRRTPRIRSGASWRHKLRSHRARAGGARPAAAPPVERRYRDHRGGQRSQAAVSAWPCPPSRAASTRIAIAAVVFTVRGHVASVCWELGRPTYHARLSRAGARGARSPSSFSPRCLLSFDIACLAVPRPLLLAARHPPTPVSLSTTYSLHPPLLSLLLLLSPYIHPQLRRSYERTRQDGAPSRARACRRTGRRAGRNRKFYYRPSTSSIAPRPPAPWGIGACETKRNSPPPQKKIHPKDKKKVRNPA
ncbi:hypothetical protein GGS23DRAFT_561812 [Durotheca rogersii]|uniref:uncharacterized protein n=1 Tax=Durotheca rogersii TaxID=419775 RepID=UPI00221F6E6A|nr:uncharacterized protein GGS23DRAFT_561812 [Durotheca rogersii]KAI5864781.1 hypothetical protein GGS23DRAFT_561812 [Durotheca rogersii]